MVSDACHIDTLHLCIGTTSVKVLPRITRGFSSFALAGGARELHALEMGLQDDGEGKPVALSSALIEYLHVPRVRTKKQEVIAFCCILLVYT